MKRFLGAIFFSSLVFVSCGSKPIQIQADQGIIIQISDLSYSKQQGKVFGFVQILNRSSSFYKVSNKELCLCYDKDTVRAFMKMPGDWEIDKGLVNIAKNKDLSYQAYWPFKSCDLSEIKAAYFKVLSREEE
jgi:hypothetical protein